MDVKTPGTMIILNGTPSAGKSSLGRVLPNILEGSWKTVEADSFVYDSVQRLINHLDSRFEIKTTLNELNDVCTKLVDNKKLTQEEIDNFFGDTFDQVFEKAKEYFQTGHKVILDWAILEENEAEEDGDLHGFNDFFNALRASNVALVLTYCPFATLIERVKKRNKEGKATEQRDYHVPIKYFSAIYKAAKQGEKPILGTLTRTEVIDILEAPFVKAEFEDIKKYKQFKSKTLKGLSLDRHKSINVTPRLKHDLIVNTGINSTEKCAQQIKRFFKSDRPFTAMRKNARKFGLIGRKSKKTKPQKTAWQKFWDYVLCRGK